MVFLSNYSLATINNFVSNWYTFNYRLATGEVSRRQKQMAQQYQRLYQDKSQTQCILNFDVALIHWLFELVFSSANDNFTTAGHVPSNCCGTEPA
jgi:hypothetical protein